MTHRPPPESSGNRSTMRPSAGRSRGSNGSRRKVTAEARFRRVRSGFCSPAMRFGGYAETARKSRNSGPRAALSPADRVLRRGGAVGDPARRSQREKWPFGVNRATPGRPERRHCDTGESRETRSGPGMAEGPLCAIGRLTLPAISLFAPFPPAGRNTVRDSW
jgi:hypothetical protein